MASKGPSGEHILCHSASIGILGRAVVCDYLLTTNKKRSRTLKQIFNTTTHLERHPGIKHNVHATHFQQEFARA